MKTVTNKTTAPLKIPLPRGKSLRLGPKKSGQIQNDATEHPQLKKLVEAGKIEIFEDSVGNSGSGTTGSAAHDVNRGHARSGATQRKGDR